MDWATHIFYRRRRIGSTMPPELFENLGRRFIALSAMRLGYVMLAMPVVAPAAVLHWIGSGLVWVSEALVGKTTDKWLGYRWLDRMIEAYAKRLYADNGTAVTKYPRTDAPRIITRKS